MGGEVAENLRELGRAEFGRSTGAMGQARAPMLA